MCVPMIGEGGAGARRCELFLIGESFSLFLELFERSS